MKRLSTINRIVLIAALVAGLVVAPAGIAGRGAGGGGGTGATISFTTTSATVGQEYRVVGSGFRPNTWVTVGAYYADTTWWNSQISDAQGNISLSFTATSPGNVVHEAKEQGKNGRLRSMATATLTVTAG